MPLGHLGFVAYVAICRIDVSAKPRAAVRVAAERRDRSKMLNRPRRVDAKDPRASRSASRTATRAPANIGSSVTVPVGSGVLCAME